MFVLFIFSAARMLALSLQAWPPHYTEIVSGRSFLITSNGSYSNYQQIYFKELFVILFYQTQVMMWELWGGRWENTDIDLKPKE